MSVPFTPDWTPDLSEHLREYVEQWQTNPARALACATQGVVNEQRARELIDGTGVPWRLREVSAIGMALGPSPEFWHGLNHTETR